MSDDPKKTEPVETRPEQPTVPDAPESKASPNYSLAAAWVAGGTRSSAHDKEVAQRKADAEKRRRELDAQRKMASVPIEQGGAQMYNSMLTDMHAPRIILRYGDMEILCELTNDDLTGDQLFIMTCPECYKHGAPQGESQIRIAYSQRKWHLDTSDAGQPDTYEDTDFFTGKKKRVVYVKGGVIKDTDILRCPHVACGGVKYRIDNNVLRRVY
jgi:hypothetical protein